MPTRFRFRRRIAAASLLLPLAAPVALAGPAEAAPSACRSHNLGPVKPHVRQATNKLACDFGVRTVYGYRRSNGDHGGGLATDFMVYKDKARGDGLAAHARANAGKYRIQYIIWQQRIWHVSRANEGWRKMEDRGDVTANHYDHVHISFTKAGGNKYKVVARATARKAAAKPRTSPVATRGVYTVRSGDTLSSIARRYKIDGGYQALFRANRPVVANPHRIYVGQKLRLPR